MSCKRRKVFPMPTKSLVMPKNAKDKERLVPDNVPGIPGTPGGKEVTPPAEGQLPEGYFHPDQVQQAVVQTAVETLGYPPKKVIGAPVVPPTGGETAAPTVTELLPNVATIGDPSFTLHVRGTNFVAGSVIVFNGYDEPTTLVSPTEVTTGVNMETWFAQSAPLPVTVRNPDGQMSNALTFTFNMPAGDATKRK